MAAARSLCAKSSPLNKIGSLIIFAKAYRQHLTRYQETRTRSHPGPFLILSLHIVAVLESYLNP